MKYSWSVESSEQVCPLCEHDFFYDCKNIMAICPNCDHEFFALQPMK